MTPAPEEEEEEEPSDSAYGQYDDDGDNDIDCDDADCATDPICDLDVHQVLTIVGEGDFDIVVDLLAYILAKGDEKHPVFSGGHDHQHGEKKK